MVQHPQANRIGGRNKRGKSIYVQIDKTACGRRKYNKGKRANIWTFGGVKMPDNTFAKDYIPRSFAMTVPDRSRETLIPILKDRIHRKSNGCLSPSVITDGK